LTDVANLLARSDPMALTTGARLGPYEIQAPLGAGGMGEVYRARDTRLERTVAVKVLPAALAGDPQFRERFAREAKTISQLDHPNICAVYDVGEQEGVAFIVMQYLDGETLAQRMGDVAIDRPPIRVAEALAIAIQIADALDKAHRAGIVHRDLKPGNVILTKTGAKLLDFGLAKTGVPAVASSAGGSILPTTPANITAQGTILGTFQYMAPEQLEGAEADARTDIFAFGAVLYEMITGRKAFEGKSTVSLIGAILEREPPAISTIVPDAPPALERIVKRCLAKDPDARWQTASDLAHELRWVSETAGAPERPAAVPAAPPASRRSAPAWKIATAAMTLVAAAGVTTAYLWRPVQPALVRFFIDPPEKMSFVAGGRVGASAAISPDGRRVVFEVRESPQKLSLWVRSIGALTAQPLAGTDDASFPFWSPDSKFIAYFAHDKLMKVDASGGPPQTVCDAPGGRGGAWSPAGVIVFGSGVGAAGRDGLPLNRVPSAGGQSVPVTKAAAGSDHRFPSFLPDGRHFLFYANGAAEGNGLYVGSLDSLESRKILGAETGGIYSSGYVLFMRQSTLLAQRFDVRTLTTSADPVPVAERVTRNYAGILAFSASDTGVLTYGIGPTTQGPGGVVQLQWLDRQGKPIETVGRPGTYRGIDVAPDGRRIAAHLHEGTGGDIWIIDGARTDRFTFDGNIENESPVWSPDGAWIAFAKTRPPKGSLYRKRSNNAGIEELLVESETPVIPVGWSPDGAAIVYTGATGMFQLKISGERKPERLLAESGTLIAQVSPNGKWLAYQGFQSGAGGGPRVYVRPYGPGEGKYQLSTDPGGAPRWRNDGRELFFLEVGFPRAPRGKLMAVDVGASTASFDRSAPHALFDSGAATFQHPPGGPYQSYDVSRDGQRFLVARPVAATLGDDSSNTPVAVVLNWAAALK
jgi:eukaryotic-like serine/threonine-protein kinase